MDAARRGDDEASVKYLQQAIETEPRSEGAAFARDTLAEMYGARLYPDMVTSCPRSAQQAFANAEEQFGKGNFDAAIPLYQSAVADCPASAPMRVSLADAYFARGDHDKARGMFREAIAIDPWNRAAWRYLSDAENRLGNRTAAWEAALFAVLSDPDYQMGWVTLDYCSAKPIERIYVVKPRLARTNDGKITINIPSVDPTYPDAEAGRLAWISYGVLLNLPVVAVESRLDRERRLVLRALDAYQEIGLDKGKKASPLWDELKSANAAGFLDEAIFVRLIDKELAPDYAEFRNTHRARLIEYMKRFVTQPPASFVRPTI
ncbi:MAG TPA: tetratricopeptide repeat protein [Candidatus Limnocylindrales bacterium]|nr:tetratricopeptide repeat protein [Candidatus Limnocylindrales bacterium]